MYTTIVEGLDSVSELDSALVPLATELVSDFHSVTGLELESDSLAERGSESAPEFDSASDFQPGPVVPREQKLQFPLLPVFVECV